MKNLQDRCDGCGQFVETGSLVVDGYDETKSICPECDQKNGEMIVCFVCNKPITADEMDGREWWHEPWCNHGSPAWERDGCDCDLESHADCIPAAGTVLVEDDDDDVSA